MKEIFLSHGGCQANPPSHGWPWLWTETDGDLGIPQLKNLPPEWRNGDYPLDFGLPFFSNTPTSMRKQNMVPENARATQGNAQVWHQTNLIWLDIGFYLGFSLSLISNADGCSPSWRSFRTGVVWLPWRFGIFRVSSWIHPCFRTSAGQMSTNWPGWTAINLHIKHGNSFSEIW